MAVDERTRTMRFRYALVAAGVLLIASMIGMAVVSFLSPYWRDVLSFYQVEIIITYVALSLAYSLCLVWFVVRRMMVVAGALLGVSLVGIALAAIVSPGVREVIEMYQNEIVSVYGVLGIAYALAFAWLIRRNRK